MEDIILPEATVITDRNGEVLYRIFQENRSYVQYEDISPYMVDAIVAIEDQSFWTNNGLDYRGILRIVAGQLGLINYSGGGSTITQQLLKNILLANEPSPYRRKLKEWLLAGRLNDMIKKQIRQTNPGIGDDELQRKMKEEILELYLNYIFL
jgi:membrane peptidoglycan carboxypeptidase